jgi:hypothetical protein
MIRLFPVIQMPDGSDERRMSLAFCPINWFFLRAESAQRMVAVVFDNIIVNRASFRATFRARFN